MSEPTHVIRAWLSMLRASNSIKKSIDQQFRSQFGLSISRFDVLSALERGNRNGLRAGELSRQLVVSDGNTTQVVGKLVRDGLVLRRNDSKDARVVIYSLSDEGKEMFEKMAKAHKRWITNAFGMLSDVELEDLTELLTHLSPEAAKDQQDVA